MSRLDRVTPEPGEADTSRRPAEPSTAGSRQSKVDVSRTEQMTSRDHRYPHLAIVLAELGYGGVGKMRVHLANALVEQGYRVDFVLGHDDRHLQPALDERVPVHVLGTSNALLGVPPLAAYLRRRRPRVMLGQRIRVAVLMQRARTLARVRVRLYATVNTDLEERFRVMAQDKAKRQREYLSRYYPALDGVLAISSGVARSVTHELEQINGVPVLPNPVLTPDIEGRTGEPFDHPWLADTEVPLILGMGRLQPQKDFPTLLRAFSRLRARHRARLVILGEGEERPRLRQLAVELGVDGDVDLPGYVQNPWPWLDRADVFALSSAWEGLGNALIEAMAAGTPVVATDCRSGPAETLAGGRYGPLVPPGDDAALAAALERQLREPADPADLRAAVARFDARASAAAYASALQLGDD